MNTLFITGVRAFRRRVEVPVRKLTLLVGQNSTGKSTILACTRIAWDLAARGETDFNEQPFLLGTYNSIAHHHGGRGARVTSFSVGAEFPVPTGRQSSLPGISTAPSRLRVEGTFHSDHGSPVLSLYSADDGHFKVEATRDSNKEKVSLKYHAGTDEEQVVLDVPPTFSLSDALRYGTQRARNPAFKDNRFWQLFFGFQHLGTSRPYALAPVRSRPERTYDPISEHPNPEGDHVPALLARLQDQDSTEWKSVSNALNEFGKESGLFSRVTIRSRGKVQQGDPFQIQVTIPGQKGPRNLLDVGYGVSQVLPILVESVLRPRRFLLVQQPEVHLHPQAQAALGSFLANAAGSGSTRYMVETHSDYLIDRVAMAIRDPQHPLKAADVTLLFLENGPRGAKVHDLQFNDNGEIQKMPPSYRQFFLIEQARYLGVSA